MLYEFTFKNKQVEELFVEAPTLSEAVALAEALRPGETVLFVDLKTTARVGRIVEKETK